MSKAWEPGEPPKYTFTLGTNEDELREMNEEEFRATVADAAAMAAFNAANYASQDYHRPWRAAYAAAYNIASALLDEKIDAALKHGSHRNLRLIRTYYSGITNPAYHAARAAC